MMDLYAKLALCGEIVALAHNINTWKFVKVIISANCFSKSCVYFYIFNPEFVSLLRQFHVFH